MPYTAGQPNQGADPSLDKKDASGSGALQIQVGPDGTLTASPAGSKTAAKPATAKPVTKKPITTPNGAPESPMVSGARGGRPVGGGTSKKSPAAIAKPRTPSGNPSTKKG